MTPILFNNNENPVAITYNNNIVYTVIYNEEVVWNIERSGTWTAPKLGSRPWQNPYKLTLTGTAIEDGITGNYTYKIIVPMYYTSITDSEAKIEVWINTTGNQNDKTIIFPTFIDSSPQTWYAFNVEQTVTSSTWLGNNSTIYCFIKNSNGNKITVDSGIPFSLTITNI